MKDAQNCGTASLYGLGVLAADGRIPPTDHVAGYTWMLLARWAAE